MSNKTGQKRPIETINAAEYARRRGVTAAAVQAAIAGGHAQAASAVAEMPRTHAPAMPSAAPREPSAVDAALAARKLSAHQNAEFWQFEFVKYVKATQDGDQAALLSALAATVAIWLGAAGWNICDRRIPFAAALEADTLQSAVLAAAALDLLRVLELSPQGREAIARVAFESGGVPA